jgi:hypothetical protein
MHAISDILERLERGQSDRAIARDLRLSRLTVREYREQAAAGQLADGATAALKGGNASGTKTSMVLPYQARVEHLLAQGVQASTIYDRLCEDHGYTGSYGSVLRLVQKLRPVTCKATVRVHPAWRGSPGGRRQCRPPMWTPTPASPGPPTPSSRP